MAEAARLQRQANIHKRLADIAEQRKKLNEDEKRLLGQLEQRESTSIFKVCKIHRALTSVN